MVSQDANPVILNDSFAIPDPDDPNNPITGFTVARVRVASTDLNSPTGLADDGEVEDHQVYLDAAPVADPNGPYWINTNEDLWLDASASSNPDDPNSTVDQYIWDFTYDPSLPYDPADERTFFNPEFVTDQPIDVIPWPWDTVFQVPQPRPIDGLTIALRVVDNLGAISDIATTKLFVFDNEVHAIYEVPAGPFMPEENITFDATASFHDREAPTFDKHLVKYEWDFDYDGTFSPDVVKEPWTWNGNDWVEDTTVVDPEKADWSYEKFGTYTAVLRITDSNDPAKSDMYSQTIHVTDGNVPPEADADGPYTINVSSPVTLIGENSTFDDGTQTNPGAAPLPGNPDLGGWGDHIVSWEWDLNPTDNDGYEYQGENVLLSWSDLMPYIDVPNEDEGYTANPIRLRVTDSLGETHTDDTVLYIHENMPHAVVTAPVSPFSIAPGDTVVFDASDSWHDRNPADLQNHLHVSGDAHTWDNAEDRNIVTYQWDFDYDDTFTANPAYTTAKVNYDQFTQFGVYEVMLRVRDDNSPARSDLLETPIEIRVNGGDVIPVADPDGPYYGYLNNSGVVSADIVLDASGSYDANAAAGDMITNYQWTLVLEPGQPNLVIDTPNPTYTLTADVLNNLNLVATQEYDLQLVVYDKAFDGAVTSDPSLMVDTTLSVHPDTLTAQLDADATSVAPGTTIHFDATASENPHPLHDIVKYEWDLDGDGTFEFTQNTGDANFGLASQTYDVFAMFTASVRVTDDRNVTDTATVNIQVLDGVDDPVANAGRTAGNASKAYILDIGQSLVLDGSLSTPGQDDALYGDFLTYEWDLNGDGTVDATGVNPTVTWAELVNLGVTSTAPAVSYQVSLTVTDQFDANYAIDGIGGSATDVSPLHIYNNVLNAVFVATPDLTNPIGITTPVKFDGTGSGNARPDIDVVKYEWDFDGDGQYNGPWDVVQDNPAAADFGIVENFTFPEYGKYDVTLRVTDNNAEPKTATYTVNVEVSQGNQDPEANLSAPTMIETGQGITLDGSASQETEPGDSIVSYVWTVDGTQLGANQAIVNLTWNDLVDLNLTDPADVDVKLTVTDEWGNQDEADANFGVFDNEPVAAFTANPNPANCNEDVNFDASTSSHTWPAGTITKYEWDFNYGGNPNNFDVDAEGVTAKNSYSLFDDYQAALRVTDSNGKAAIAVLTIDVSLGNDAPTADAGGPYVFASGDIVILDGSGSFDPDEACGDSIVAYRWDLDYDPAEGFDVDYTGEKPVIPPGSLPVDQQVTIALQVVDAQEGLLDIDATTLIITTNAAPVANAGGPYVFTEGTEFNLDGTGSTDDTGIVTYEWDLDYGGDPNNFDVDATGAQPPVTFGDDIATRTIALRVIDGGGKSDIHTTTLTVNNVDPTAGIDTLPTDVREGQTVTITSVVDDPGQDDIHTFDWTITLDGNQVATGTDENLVFTPVDNGAYQVTLTVTDDDGGEDTEVQTLNIVNADPEAGDVTLAPVVTIDGQALIGAGQAVTVSGAFTDPGTLDTHSVSINWGDGTTTDANVDQAAGTGTYQADHTFNASGRFNVVVTVTDNGGASHQADATVNVVDNLGVVDFNDSLADQDPSVGDLWYLLTTAHDGFLTVELGGTGAASAAGALFDANGNPVGPVNDGPSDGTDFLVAAGTNFYFKLSGSAADVDVRLTNLVSVDGAAITVSGTDQDDAFEFELTESYIVRINGTQYHFADTADTPETVNFDGGLGTDSAEFTGSEEDESGRFFTGTGEFYSGSETYDQTGFFVNVVAENLVAHSEGGRDFIKMYDSPGDDTFTSSPTMSSLVGPGYSHTAHDFYVGLGYAVNREGTGRTGGNDQAVMTGSEGKDKFKLDWADETQFFGKLYGGSYYTRAKNFENIDADGNGGDDLAVAIGTPDDNVNSEFFLKKGVGRVSTARTQVEYLGFNTVVAIAGSGYDVALFEDSAGDDELRGRSHKTTLIGPGYDFTARKFDEVKAEAKNGGFDRAKLHDTSLDDILHAEERSGQTWAQLAIDGAVEDPLYEALAFEFVKAYSSEGNDKVDRTEDFDWLFFDGEWTDE